MKKSYFAVALVSIFLTACGSSGGGSGGAISAAGTALAGTDWTHQMTTGAGTPCTWAVKFLNHEDFSAAIQCNYGSYVRAEKISGKIAITDSKIIFMSVENHCSDSALSSVNAGDAAPFVLSGNSLSITMSSGTLVFQRNGTVQGAGLPEQAGCLLDPVVNGQDNWQLL